jgi:hypothetical protein
MTMQPVSGLPTDAAKAVKAVLCDIDDTLTWQGRLPAMAYAALESLRAAGLKVVPVTGRPAGWCDHIARMWPVDGVVGENGAFWFRHDDTAHRMRRGYWRSDAERAEDRNRLAALREEILAAVPGAAISADQGYREADLAIDFCEDVPPLPASEIDRIVSLFEKAGAVAKVSSIHVNGWFGDYDKLSMSRRFLAEAFGIDIDAAPRSVAFVGDSPNDEPMFDFFPLGIGVANVRDFTDRMASPPAFVTARPGGEGFAEFADILLRARSE